MHPDIFQLISSHDSVGLLAGQNALHSPSYCYIPYTGAKRVDLSSLTRLDNSIPVVLDEVGCSGNEVRLIDCSSSTLHNCLHLEDIAVRCNRES